MASASLADRIAVVAASLPPAQARVARLVSDAPSVIAFGTVAEVAAEAATSPQTVLRLAARLGHDGFPGLQDEVRSELVVQLPPAATRIRHRPGPDLRSEVAAADEHNLSVSLAVDAAALRAAADLLADAGRRVAVVAAESWAGIGAVLTAQLSQLRDDVAVLDGPVPRVARELSRVGPGDVLVALDVRRYERWLVEAVARARAGDVEVVAVTDSVTSPLYGLARHAFLVGVAGPGPFESITGVAGLVHLLVTEVASRLREDARTRLDAVERAWADHGALLDG